MSFSTSQILEQWLDALSYNQESTPLDIKDVDEPLAWNLGASVAAWCHQWANLHQEHLCLFLQGNLGSGKTHVCRSIVFHLTHTPIHEIESPTYSYVIPYQSQGIDLFHYDLYRVKNLEQLQLLSLDEPWHDRGISLIEWPALIKQFIQMPSLSLEISYQAGLTRHWRWTWNPRHPQTKTHKDSAS